jgi:hypothetical protein
MSDVEETVRCVRCGNRDALLTRDLCMPCSVTVCIEIRDGIVQFESYLAELASSDERRP